VPRPQREQPRATRLSKANAGGSRTSCVEGHRNCGIFATPSGPPKRTARAHARPRAGGDRARKSPTRFRPDPARL